MFLLSPLINNINEHLKVNINKCAFYHYQASPPFESMDDFVDQTEYKWSLIDGTYYGGYFKVSVLQDFD